MKYNFDELIDRHGTGALKTDILKEKFGREDLISLWIADMDFRTPEIILDAIKHRLEHPIFGYSCASDSYYRSLVEWEMKCHGWKIAKEELCFVPGIVKGIAFVIECFTEKGDGVVVQPPVYMPFLSLPVVDKRKVYFNPLICKDGNYTMDLSDLEKTFKEKKPKVMIISNPHNPCGRIWEKAELAALAELCNKYNVLVISDEIHADMPLYGAKHTPFLASGKDAEKVGICFCAPSKTFNMAGIVSSFSVVKNPELRQTFYDFLRGNDFATPMVLSTVATEAAFTKCDEWHRQCMDYIQANIDFVADYLAENIPQITVVKPHASFLMWLNCTGLGLSHDALIDLFVNKAHLALNDGEDFGPGGEGHMRLNVGCPRSVLAKAMEQLKNAVNS
ncbi:MAG: pyridoxal phosphate-dependent aminotransferase [Bacteroidales bacterium]|nr:pyridoxal phosphate-dependent aminotransferase [Bacteroidales bacterium]